MIEEKIELTVYVLVFIGSLLSWTVCHLLCEFKYFWCKRNCKRCGNWQCKYFEK